MVHTVHVWYIPYTYDTYILYTYAAHHTVYVWYIPYMNGGHRTRMVHTVHEWYIPYMNGGCMVHMVVPHEYAWLPHFQETNCIPYDPGTGVTYNCSYLYHSYYFQVRPTFINCHPPACHLVITIVIRDL